MSGLRWTLPLDGETLPDRALIGGKAWSLARMGALRLPVPPAFVITTDACRSYMAGSALPEGLEAEVRAGLAWLEERSRRTYGKGPHPLLVSVRSGAAISMPGMMDTVLNMGICADTEGALGREFGSDEFGAEVQRRFLELFATIVMKAPAVELPQGAGRARWEALVAAAAGAAVPADPFERLMMAVRAVFDSWNSRRARRYRQHQGIADDLGTAVTIQAMVFGNADADSGTGVLFSRNPLDGDLAPFGEYLPRAQGEDVVSGRRTPLGLGALHDALPDLHARLLQSAAILEREQRDMQDIEFTVERGKLYLLQSRAGKRAPMAAARIATDLCNEGLIDRATALSRVSPEQIRMLLAPRLDRQALAAATVLATGEAASPGVGAGRVVTSSDEAERRAAAGEAVVLARATTSPEDVHGMVCARAVVTEAGGATSHAAVVGRALGKPCVVGTGAGSLAGLAGRQVTVDGASGRVYDGLLPAHECALSDFPALEDLASWAAEASPLRVVASRDELGAVGLVDLDGLDGGSDVGRLPGLIAGARAVGGGAIASDAGVAAAVAAGVEWIVATPVLPAQIAAIHAATR